MSVELFAVNAVSDRIAACPRLTPDIKSGDTTPITDGHIDFYSSDKKDNKSHAGRVPVQVKGRVTAAKGKASRDTQSFQIEREVLQFFRNHGGGLYFYVPMREGGIEREVFFVNLIPFKIDRLMNGKPATQRSFSVKMTRLPEDSSKIEGIVRLAWNARTQVSVAGGNGDLLNQAESITVHSLAGFDESRPTRLALADSDFVVIAHLPGGLDIAIDVDLDVLPQEYVERPITVPITCGGIEFSNGTGRRLDDETLLVQLSPALQLRLKIANGTISTNLDLSREGTFQEQAKNFDFVIAAASGSPLLIGDGVNEPHAGDPRLESELRIIRDELSRFIELFDELGIDDALTSQLQLDDETRKMLGALREGLVDDQQVRGTSDGTGRYDIPLGEGKIMVIVMPAEDQGFRRIIDPFDPSKRNRFRMYRLNEDGSAEPIEWGTVYDSLTPEDMSTILNLRLRHIVTAYEELEDRESSAAKANYTVLRLVSAADLATDENHGAALLQGAADLCGWLLQEDPDSLVHRVNRWQILYRRHELSVEERRDIRAARRGMNRDDTQADLLEVCMLVLLEDNDELQLALADLTDDDVEKLHSWPIWALARADRTSTPEITV